jgi:hypothetical protein
MSKKTRGGSRQPELFGRSKSPTIPIEENHRLVQLADRLDWTELEVPPASRSSHPTATQRFEHS